MEAIFETKTATILQFIHGLRGSLRVTFEEGTWAAWLHDLLKPHVSEVLVCDPRKNRVEKVCKKNDRNDARESAELLYRNKIQAVYHGQHGLRTLMELARSYLTLTRDLTRVMARLKAIYRSWAIPGAGEQPDSPPRVTPGKPKTFRGAFVVRPHLEWVLSLPGLMALRLV